MPSAHAHLEVELNYVRSGRMEYGFGTVEAGTLVAFWAALPHQLIRVEPGTRCVWALLPLASVLRAGLPAETVDRLLAGDLLQIPMPEGVPMRWLEADDPGSRRATRLEIQAALLRMRPAPRLAVGDGSGAVAGMCAHIAAHYREPVAVADVAEAVGLHPGSAMRLFRQATGLTIGDALLRHRLAHAQRLLVDTSLSVEVVAADSGFGSPSRFYEAFRARTGQTPREYRRTLD